MNQPERDKIKADGLKRRAKFERDHPRKTSVYRPRFVEKLETKRRKK